MRIEYTTFSETGKRRANQDVCRVIEMPEHNRTLMIVCDGMGGYSMGDVAAEIVCDAICEYWTNNTETPDTETKVIEACEVAFDALDTPSRISHIMMGTTMVTASVEGDIVTIAHCGDSRCYLLRDGAVVYQTKDHADAHCGSESVTRCFLSYFLDAAVPDIVQFTVKRGDRIYLCSMGSIKRWLHKY